MSLPCDCCSHLSKIILGGYSSTYHEGAYVDGGAWRAVYRRTSEQVLLCPVCMASIQALEAVCVEIAGGR
jgi:hypothetical protein